VASTSGEASVFDYVCVSHVASRLL
jgi:hypothetical protein